MVSGMRLSVKMELKVKMLSCNIRQRKLIEEHLEVVGGLMVIMAMDWSSSELFKMEIPNQSTSAMVNALRYVMLILAAMAIMRQQDLEA